MDLKLIHDILDLYLRKHQAGYLSLADKDKVLDRAQIQYMDRLKPAFAANQQIHDALLPFKAKYAFTNSTSVDGAIELPADYVHLLAVETQVMDDGHTIYPTVEMVQEDELGKRKSSQLLPVTVKNPIGVLEKGKVQLYPAQASAGTLYYLRKPTTPKYAFTQSGRVITYDKDASVQLEWNDPSTEKIIFIALQLLGLPLEDINAIQFGQAKEAQQ